MGRIGATSRIAGYLSLVRRDGRGLHFRTHRIGSCRRSAGPPSTSFQRASGSMPSARSAEASLVRCPALGTAIRKSGDFDLGTEVTFLRSGVFLFISRHVSRRSVRL
jgi:hypothetical protein